MDLAYDEPTVNINGNILTLNDIEKYKIIVESDIHEIETKMIFCDADGLYEELLQNRKKLKNKIENIMNEIKFKSLYQ